jgi:Neuraminidase (sialidase)
MRSAILAAILPPGGRNGPQLFNDKESVTADPVKAGYAYATWDRLQGPTSKPYGSLHALAYTGPAYFSMTPDGGHTWSTPRVIVPTSQNQQTIGNQIVVDGNSGELYDFFDWITTPSKYPYKVAFVKSTDGGATWSAPQIINTLQTVYVSDPNTGQSIRTGDIIPEPAIDPASGKLYVVWQDSRFNGGHYDEVIISSSADGGAAWTAPVRVNTPTGQPAFTPSVRVNSSGAVGVTYYDFRNLQAGNTTTLPTDYWFTSSADGGATWGGETHLAGSFDMLTAPYAGGFFTGDYEALAVAGKSFVPFFVAANSENTANRTDVFTGSVTP